MSSRGGRGVERCLWLVVEAVVRQECFEAGLPCEKFCPGENRLQRRHVWQNKLDIGAVLNRIISSPFFQRDFFQSRTWGLLSRVVLNDHSKVGA